MKKETYIVWVVTVKSLFCSSPVWCICEDILALNVAQGFVWTVSSANDVNPAWPPGCVMLNLLLNVWACEAFCWDSPQHLCSTNKTSRHELMTHRHAATLLFLLPFLPSPCLHVSIFKLAVSHLLFYDSYSIKIRSTIVSKGMCLTQRESLALKLAAFSHSSLCDSTLQTVCELIAKAEVNFSLSVYTTYFNITRTKKVPEECVSLSADSFYLLRMTEAYFSQLVIQFKSNLSFFLSLFLHSLEG